MFSLSSPLLWPPGGLGRGRGLDPLPESCGLAPLQKHLPGVVRDRARGGPVQRRHHGPVGLRHPALCVRALVGGHQSCVWVAEVGEVKRRGRKGRLELNVAWTWLCRGCEEGWFYAAWLQMSFPNSFEFRFYLFWLQKNVIKEHVHPFIRPAVHMTTFENNSQHYVRLLEKKAAVFPFYFRIKEANN